MQLLQEAEADGRSGLSTDMLTQVLQDDAQAAYDKRTQELTEPVMRELERVEGTHVAHPAIVSPPLTLIT